MESNISYFKQIFFLIATLTVGSSDAVIIVVPGTWAAGETWYRPNGDFFGKIEKYVSEKNKKYGTTEKVVSFHWSGNNNTRARVNAAFALTQLIVSYPDSEPITLIGHSHGSNVIALSSQFLYNPMAHPETLPAEQQSLLQRVRSLFTKKDDNTVTKITKRIKKKRVKGTKHTIVTLAVKRARAKFHKNSTTQRTIKTALFMGTPVEIKNYAPNTKVIDQVLSLFSEGDPLQPVLGHYDRMYEPQKKVVNLRLRVDTAQGNLKKPGHLALRSPIIGQQLLAVPEILQNEGITPDVFDQYRLIDIIFFENGSTPVISPQKIEAMSAPERSYIDIETMSNTFTETSVLPLQQDEISALTQLI